MTPKTVLVLVSQRSGLPSLQETGSLFAWTNDHSPRGDVGRGQEAGRGNVSQGGWAAEGLELRTLPSRSEQLLRGIRG